jgi:hypothetical protein
VPVQAKNKKVTENIFFYYFSSQKFVISKIFFVMSCQNSTELFKNSVRKSKAKICNRKFATFFTPFQANMHQNAPISDISPLLHNLKSRFKLHLHKGANDT